MRAHLISSLLFMLLSISAFAQTYPAFNLKDWPPDIMTPLTQKHPALLQKSFTAEEISVLIKDIHRDLNFNQLKVVEKDDALYLVGTLSSKVEAINFTGLKEIDEEEALEILALNLSDAQDENKVAAAVDRLQNYFKNIGYRKAQINSRVVNKSTTTRDVIIEINSGQKTRISEVKIEGLPAGETLEIERDFTWNGKGKILSDTNLKIVSRSLRKSLNTFGYYLVNIQPPSISFSADEQRARLNFRLIAQPKYKIEIVGQQFAHKESNELSINKPVLFNEVLKIDDYFTNDQNFGSDLAEKIRLHYLSQGYAYCEVLYYERKEGNLTIITLNVNEGPLVNINKISVIGNISRPEKYYVNTFEKLSSTKTQEHVLIQEDIEQAAKNLITYLQNEGFVNAKLSRIQVGTENKRSNKAMVVLQIEEGPQATIDKITISGNRFFSTDKINEVLGLQPGQKLSLIDLEIALNNLKVFYADNGFIESKLLSENKNLIQYSDSLTEASIRVDIFEGPQIRVGSILIEGNEMTHAKLILTELDFKVGELLTPTKLDESTTRLQRTGHFSTIEIYTLEANTDVQERTVVVRVNERKPGVGTVGIGVTNENNVTLHGFAGIAYRNIGGWGRGASLRGEAKYNPEIINFLEYKATAGYLEPYLFDTRVRFRVNYTTARDISDLSIKKVTITNQTVWSLEQDFTSHLTGIYEILNISNYVDRGITRQDEIDNNYEREDLVISTTGPTIDIDYRNNILNPTDGHWTRLTLEYSSDTIGNHNVDDFYRATGQFSLYTPLLEEKGLVWVNSYRAGYVKTLGSQEFGVPFDKKGFILGGRSTIRGFESSEFFPTTNLQLPASYKLDNYSVYQLIKSEFRFPLFGSENLAGAVFYDGGEVQVDHIVFTDRYRDAAGVGLRYNTPVGPLNLEYARKLDKKSYESEGAFHLSVGIF
ncbi:MAG: POTRA domain-containing protein [Bdellovibrionota bacterium]